MKLKIYSNRRSKMIRLVSVKKNLMNTKINLSQKIQNSNFDFQILLVKFDQSSVWDCFRVLKDIQVKKLKHIG
jgi:hypothetical protein